MHWLDAHQGTATTVLTLVLVLVTAYYAFQNRQMVLEMRRSRNAALLPKLALGFQRVGPTTVMLSVRNVGPGAALNPHLVMTWRPKGGEDVTRPWRGRVLPSGESIDFFPPSGDLNNSMNWIPEVFSEIRLSGRMADAAGELHEVDELFDNLADWRQVLVESKMRYRQDDQNHV